MTLAELPAFIEEMAHAGTDYNTTAEATAAAAAATAWALCHQFGLSGFQGGWVMWEFMHLWNGIGERSPARLIDYEDLLYPQFEGKFRSIPADVWEWAQNAAKEKIARSSPWSRRDSENGTMLMSEDVFRHWESVAAGVVPFGLRIEE
jgi:hypothetical protein